MKRSQINAAIEKAKNRLDEYRISLPPFGYWKLDDWKKAAPECGMIFDGMLGWDVTDFGSDDFAHTGAVLFTVRNGDKNDPKLRRPYAEKYIILDDRTEQEIPLHYHIDKTEDIINRAGGVLVIQMYHSTPDNKLDKEKPVSVRLDGILRTFAPGEDIEIMPGASITIEPYVFHRFIAKKDAGLLIVGEVSRVNDDNTDNVFLVPSERFIGLDEDEAIVHPLVNEVRELCR